MEVRGLKFFVVLKFNKSISCKNKLNKKSSWYMMHAICVHVLCANRIGMFTHWQVHPHCGSIEVHHTQHFDPVGRENPSEYLRYEGFSQLETQPTNIKISYFHMGGGIA